MKHVLASIPILFAAMLLGAPARADAIAPWYASCQGMSAGTSCLYNDVDATQGTGTCQNGVCVLGAGTTTKTSTNTATATHTDAGTPAGKDDVGCSIGKQVTAKRVAPWLLAGPFSLLFLFGRRQRRG
jgi:hypothetical protein